MHTMVMTNVTGAENTCTTNYRDHKPGKYMNRNGIVFFACLPTQI